MKLQEMPQSIDVTDLIDDILRNAPKDSMIFIEKSLAMSHHIAEILESKGLMQKDLAEMLDKSEAEVSKWLSGTHNLTLRTISKIEAVLGESIMEIPSQSKPQTPAKTFKAPKRKVQAELV
jgi:ribosome-binding protein aMBF1 (putative translation factor)